DLRGFGLVREACPPRGAGVKRLFLVWIVGLLLSACGGVPGSSPDPNPFRIVSGSENQLLEPILQRFAKDQRSGLNVSYEGSVDMMLQLQAGRVDFDAIWPANSMWVAMGDTQHQVSGLKSVMRSPVIWGVKRSVAQSLGWNTPGKEVRVKDLLAA